MAILYTGTNPKKYQNLGGIIHFPMIEITSAKINPEQIKILIDKLPQYSMILLTSRFGVKYFFSFIEEQSYLLEKLQEKIFITIGTSTSQALEIHGFKPALESKLETSQGLFDEMKQQFNLKDKNILFPRSALSNPYLRDHLRGEGAVVDEFVVYQNIKPKKRPLPEESIDEVIFTSPSTVRNFLQDYLSIPDIWRIRSKGLVTAKFLEEAGYKNEVLRND